MTIKKVLTAKAEIGLVQVITEEDGIVKVRVEFIQSRFKNCPHKVLYEK